VIRPALVAVAEGSPDRQASDTADDPVH